MVGVLIILATLAQLVISKNISFNIIGGNFSQIKEFPHSVALFIQSEHNRGSMKGCGASIIKDLILLTAANCVKTVPEKVEAYTGDNYIWDGTLTKVRRIRRHPRFNEKSFVCDIALLKLVTPLKLGRRVGKVALLRKYSHWPSEVAGFGAADPEEKHSYLKHTKQKILRRDACVRRIFKIPEGTFCARYPFGYAAYDDAGSALVQYRLIQTGLVSFEAIPDKTIGVYTNVTFYYDWVTTITAVMYCRDGQHRQEDNDDSANHVSDGDVSDGDVSDGDASDTYVSSSDDSDTYVSSSDDSDGDASANNSEEDNYTEQDEHGWKKTDRQFHFTTTQDYFDQY